MKKIFSLLLLSLVAFVFSNTSTEGVVHADAPVTIGNDGSSEGSTSGSTSGSDSGAGGGDGGSCGGGGT